MSKILITGAAGFIGYHLSRSLLEDGIIVFGVDNLNNYYDTDLKEQRLKRLKSFKNFSFKKIDLIDEKKINNVFLNFNPSIVIHLAAQAGVRYSITNPYEYFSSNLLGFCNVLHLAKENKAQNDLLVQLQNEDGSPISEEDIGEFDEGMFQEGGQGPRW